MFLCMVLLLFFSNHPCHPLPVPEPSLLHVLHQEQQGGAQGGEGNSEGQIEQLNEKREDPNLEDEILSFQDFADAKGHSLTVQSETLAAEMKQMEEELAEKLKLLEDELETKQKEEETLREELKHRMEYPEFKAHENMFAGEENSLYPRIKENESSERGDNKN
eukprot:TRINITY_DN22166_c0_g1_i1.p1 TRINITY_DN22166_c0_g1~~TRINITY_DN22166_c0_g1_i1.p1  ORF type:complete len:163 (-),score=62.61 TRINITY_DN22166_c0_g1_i1:77-565(-)